MATLTRTQKLIAAAEATVMIPDPIPRERGKFIVGFRVDPSKLEFIGLIEAFEEMVALAQSNKGASAR